MHSVVRREVGRAAVEVVHPPVGRHPERAEDPDQLGAALHERGRARGQSAPVAHRRDDHLARPGRRRREVVGGDGQRRSTHGVGHGPSGDRQHVPAVGVAADVPPVVDLAPVAVDATSPVARPADRARRRSRPRTSTSTERPGHGAKGIDSLERVSRFYVTTPIYYVNDAPHVGHAYTTVIADALARWHRLVGDDTYFLTGTDEHGLKVAQSADEAGHHARRSRPTATPPASSEAWDLLDISYDDFIRTTEPRHHLAVQELLHPDQGQRRHRARHVRGPVLRVVRGVLPGERAGRRRAAARSTSARSSGSRRRTTSSASAATSSACSTGSTNDPDVIQPEAKRNEVLGFLRQGLDDVSITRTSLDWGVPVPWAEGHVFYVWYDALINYATAIGFGTDDERFETWWPAVHHLIGKEIIRFHCVYWPAMLLAAGHRPAAPRPRPRLAAARRREAVQDGPRRGEAHRHRAGPPRRGLRRRRVPLPLPARRAVRSRRRLQLRADGRPLQRRPRQQPRQPAVAGGHRRRQEVRRRRPGAAARQPAGVRRRRRRRGDGARRGSASQPSVALDATWRLIRETNAYLEANEPWKARARARASTSCSATPSRRCASSSSSPRRRSRRRRRRSGSASGCPAGRRPAGARRRGRGAATPAGSRSTKGAPLFPRIKA